MENELPKHLVKYITSQDYDLYSYEDQAVWRFIMRQLFSFLKDNAHECYSDGLKKTGISIEEIPKISEMDEMLKEYGWRAVPVSGFIPPAAFMSFQSHKILPIACEMRSIEHILYTPAPDIVHEAAGHAPMLINKDYTKYLSSYGEVAAKAIISSEDLSLYEAIRSLSDIKEDSKSTPEEIQKAEDHLTTVSKNISYVSEAQLLGRMNWWTAEYGLIGNIDSPKIYGAGLLSSIGESKNFLKKPNHLEFNLSCLDYSYDITEQQPQLFVAKSFDHLESCLKSMSDKMAFTQGGEEGIKKAVAAKSVCTVVLSNNSTYSGVITDFQLDQNNKIISLKVNSPCLVNNTKLLTEDSSFTFKESLSIESVHGGPSSFEAYPSYENFSSKKIDRSQSSDSESEQILKRIRDYRKENPSEEALAKITTDYFEKASEHWLAGLEIFELSKNDKLLNHLNKLKENQTNEIKTCIDLGLSLL